VPSSGVLARTDPALPGGNNAPVKIVAAMPNHLGSGYHRALVPLRAISVRGHGVDLAVLGDANPLAGADILYLPIAQRATMFAFAEDFQARGGRVVYEFDDDYRATPRSNPVTALPAFEESVAMMNRIMQVADVVVTATPVLADAYRDLNPRMFVCRNSIDPQEAACFFGLGEPPDDGTLRIGWGGSTSHAEDIGLVVEPVTRILEERQHARFVLVGADFRRLFPGHVRARVEFAGHSWYVNDDGTGREFCAPGEVWPSVRYLHLLAAQRLHAAIAPLIDDRFNRAKSDLKLLEYAALGIPAIASDVTPYGAYVRERGGAGAVVLARTAGDWFDALSRLLDDPAERGRLRRANRDNVLRRHLVYHHVDRWEQALHAALGR
jgi:hypothetical protein